MARWEMGAANGLMQKTVKDKIAFIVASSAIRFRRELRPMQAFEVHTSLLAAGERDMHILQVAKGADGGKLYAGALVRAVLRRGRERISPREIVSELGGDATALPFADGSAETQALATLEELLSS